MPIPLYFQITRVLESRIQSGRYAPGSLLGTEKDLAAEFGVSRITVQHALDALAREGLVVRRRAHGTFVASTVRPRGPIELHGFLDDLLLTGAIGQTRQVERDAVRATADVAERLGVTEGTPIARIQRLRANDGVINTFAIDYLPADLADRWTAFELQAHSLIELIDQTPGFQLVRGHELISARAAGDFVAARLGVSPDVPTLLVERELQTLDDRTVDFTQFYYLEHPQTVRVNRIRR